MRSHLTRRVFRQILRNRPFTHAQYALQYNPCHCIWSLDLPARIGESRRTFLFGDASEKPRRTPKGPDLDPGVSDLIQFRNQLRLGHRAPQPALVVKSLLQFSRFKQKPNAKVNDIELQFAFAAIRHLSEKGELIKEELISDADLLGLLKLSGRSTKPEVGAAFADTIFTQLLQRGYKPAQKLVGLESKELQGEPLYLYLQVLKDCRKGDQIKSLLEELPPNIPLSLWEHALASFVREERANDFFDLLIHLQKQGHRLDVEVCTDLSEEIVKYGSPEMCKKWFFDFVHDHPSDSKSYPNITAAERFILERCITERDLEFGQIVVNHILDTGPTKEAWDSVLKWAVLKEQGIDRLKEMIAVMNHNLEERVRDELADTTTLNGLIGTAYSISSPSLVEQLKTTGAEYDISLDCNSYLLQVRNCLHIKDIYGARNALEQAQSFDISPDTVTNQLLPLTNQLVRMLCETKPDDHATIMQYVQEIAESKQHFEPKTVEVLTKFHLKNGELLDAIDILQTNAHHFDQSDRLSIQGMLIQFVKDRENLTGKAWEAYNILREIFPEISLDVRTKLMNEFFARKRCDMAVHVFGHMRQAQYQEIRPTNDTYITCLEGISKFFDPEMVELVHNMLKMDVEVEPDTRLRNALMLAYLACDRADRSLEFWEEIVYSREGPTYNSIRIAFRACEMSAFGDDHADGIWRKLQEFGVETTPEIYAAYVGALAGQGMVEEAIEAVSNMERAILSRPNILTLGTLHNASTELSKKSRVIDWAQENFPDVWAELEALGLTERGNFRISRELSA